MREYGLEAWRRRSALTHLGLVLGIASAIALLPKHARAEATAAERETARAAMDEGDRLREAGDLHAALTNYKAADEIMHVPTTGIEVARTLVQLGMLVEARSSAIETANLPLAPAEPAVFTSAREDASALAAELELRIPSIVTAVQPKAASYTLSIDQIELPAQARSLPFRTNPGEHVVSVKAAGFVTATKQFVLAEGERRTLAIELKPIVVPAAPAPLVVRSDRPSDTGSAARLRGYVGIAAGGAVLLGGAITGIVSIVDANDLERRCKPGCAASDRSGLRSANALANVANVAIPLGLIGVAYGIYALVTAPSARPPSAASRGLQLEASAQGAYAGWAGDL